MTTPNSRLTLSSAHTNNNLEASADVSIPIERASNTDDQPQTGGISNPGFDRRQSQTSSAASSAGSSVSQHSGNLLIRTHHSTERLHTTQGHLPRRHIFTPSVSATIGLGEFIGVNMPSTDSSSMTSSPTTSSASAQHVRQAMSGGTTCPPCPTFAPFPTIYPGGAGNLPSTTSRSSPNVVITSTITATESLTTPTSTLAETATAASQGTAQGQQQLQPTNTHGFAMSCMTGMRYQADLTGACVAGGDVHQLSLISSAGIHHLVADANISASVGVQTDLTQRNAQHSVFVESAHCARLGYFVRRVENDTNIQEQNDAGTGRFGLGVGTSTRSQDHWIIDSSTRSRMRAGTAALVTSAAHVAGAALGGWIGANTGMPNQGMAVGAAAATNVAARILRAIPATRPDYSTEVRATGLQLPVRFQVAQTGLGQLMLDANVSLDMAVEDRRLEPEPEPERRIPSPSPMHVVETREGLELRFRGNNSSSGDSTENRIIRRPTYSSDL